MASLSLCRGWRSRRIYASTAVQMAAESHEAAEQIIQVMPDSREKRHAQRVLDESKKISSE
jgi:hypothetical protein